MRKVINTLCYGNVENLMFFPYNYLFLNHDQIFLAYSYFILSLNINHEMVHDAFLTESHVMKGPITMIESRNMCVFHNFFARLLQNVH